MNLASWIILAIVVVIVGLAVKATFFKKKSRGGCCDTSDKPSSHSCCESKKPRGLQEPAECDGSEYQIKLESGACGSCTLCRDSATARNAVQPIIKPVSQ